MKDYDLMIGLLADQLVAYRPCMARALGSPNCALFFQQIAYQAKDLPASEEGYSAWVYKTRAKMEQETALRRSEQETCRRKLRKLCVLEEVLRGVPAKMHYRINWTKTFELLQGVAVGGNPTNLPEASRHASGPGFNNQEGGEAASSEAGSPPGERVSEIQRENPSETPGEIARVGADQVPRASEYEGTMVAVSQLSTEEYEGFLGRDFADGGERRFHLSESGELFVYEEGFAPEHRRLVGRPARGRDRRRKPPPPRAAGAAS